MDKTKKAEIFINIEITGNDPDKAIDTLIKKVMDTIKSDCEILEGKQYKFDVRMAHKKMKKFK